MTRSGRNLCLLIAMAATMVLRAPTALATDSAPAAAPGRTIRLAQSKQDNDRSIRQPPGISQPQPNTPPRIVCIGGKVANGRCLCRSGSTLVPAPGGFYCRRPLRRPEPVHPSLIEPKPSSEGDAAVSCGGGRVVRGRCRCPVVTRLQSGACRRRAARTPPIGGKSPRVSSDYRGLRAITKPRRAGDTALLPPTGAALIAPGPQAIPPDLRPPTATDVTVRAEVVAVLPASAPTAIEEEVARTFNLVLIERISLTLTGERLIRFRIPDTRTVDEVVSALGSDGRLTGPQANVVYRNQGSGAALGNLQYSVAKVDLPEAHAFARGAGVVVAVIDSGVDRHHPDLAGVVVDEIDITGEDAVAQSAVDPHGTAIAGIIAARGLVKGIAPSARILSVKAFRSSASGSASYSTTSLLAAGIDRAVGTSVQILNMSFAGGKDAILHRLIKAAAAKGVVLVAAAGNNGPGAPVAYPGGYPEVLAVTVTDAADRLYEKANRGEYIALAAPGVDVLAPGPARSHQLQSGTSYAAAHVSGLLALMIERRPGLTAAEARAALASTAVDLGRPGPDADFGAGRINAAAALRRIVTAP